MMQKTLFKTDNSQKSPSSGVPLDAVVSKPLLLHGDCLEMMKDIPDRGVDMILCDLPYGTTRNKWDSIIPLDSLWKEYKRIIKERGAIVLTAQTPFDKILGCSNLGMLKYEWIWEKDKASGHLNAKKNADESPRKYTGVL